MTNHSLAKNDSFYAKEKLFATITTMVTCPALSAHSNRLMSMQNICQTDNNYMDFRKRFFLLYILRPKTSLFGPDGESVKSGNCIKTDLKNHILILN